MDGVKEALGSRGMTVEAAHQCPSDRNECVLPCVFEGD